MKKNIILTVVLLIVAGALSAQDLLRPDSSRMHWLVKPPPINEILKPAPFDAFRNTDNFLKPPTSVFDTLPATWGEFKSAFLDLPLPEEFALTDRFYLNMEMGKNYPTSIWFDPENNFLSPMGAKPPYVVGGGVGISVIQTMYDKYSHEGKMRRKYASIMQQENFERQIYPKYNITLVKQITGLTSDSAAYAFMKFCDFKNDSLLQATNYDIYWMLQNCLTQFLLQRP